MANRQGAGTATTTTLFVRYKYLIEAERSPVLLVSLSLDCEQ
jgi:hypothetical protein